MEIKEVFCSNDYIFQSDAPIIVTNMSLFKEEETQEVKAEFCFLNNSDKKLSAMVVCIGGKDVWGKESEVFTEYQYLDLNVAKGETFGKNVKVVLNDTNVRTLSIQIVKLLFDDGEAVECSGETRVFAAPEKLSSYFNNEDIRTAFIRETTVHAIYVPKQEEEFWICTCGGVNNNGECCYKCNSEYENLKTLVEDREGLEERAIIFKKREEARRKILQEKEEARRRAEEEETRQLLIAREAELQKEKTKKVLLIAVPAAIVSIIFCVLFIAPAIQYNAAARAFDYGNYEQAYNNFEKLNTYKDSETRAKEAKFKWACQLEENEEYEEAYLKFEELGNEQRRNAAMLLWMAQALGGGDRDAVEHFCKTASIDTSNASLVYSTLALYIEAHPTVDFWVNNRDATLNVISVLEQIPSGHEEKEELLVIFKGILDEGVYRAFYENYTKEIKACWGFGFIKDMVEQDEVIIGFLKGHWTSGSYYFTVDDKYSVAHNFPFVAKPAGTKYYDIESMVFRYEGENGEFKANVYRFEILDYNRVNIYCYKNGRTYTMTR